MSFRPRRRLALAAMLLACALAACAPSVTVATKPTATRAQPTSTPSGTFAPREYTPQQFRDAYGVTSLIQAGNTGKGQTVVLIESYGDPTIQSDINDFSARYNLPSITIQVLTPLGTVPFDSSNNDMTSWAAETALDAEVVHSIAPDANIVILTSPVDETEGTAGLPEFRQLEEYAVQHHLGNIISQSWGASEVSLNNTAGQQELKLWDAFYQQATTTQGITFTTGSGDSGATDYTDASLNQLSTTATTGFPSDEPWVTSVGGTTLLTNGSAYRETAWNGCPGGASGGGFSQFYPTPTFQQTLPPATLSQFDNRRGVPDVSAVAAPCSGWPVIFLHHWTTIGGTSAGAPLWAGLIAIGDQMAGQPLGFINPALYTIAHSSAAGQDFRDVTSGDNGVTCTLGDSQCVNQPVQVTGYTTASGWDAVTGLGSPIADKLLPDLIATVNGAP
ncbi:MAG: hypothetical protein OJF49_002057 [Ktedonobacterales bacterium]|jgi:subtilase family serine protease|nr:MAG: hypothetical protein OJF49_002057 [Ktedonobacterales bacterium]